MERSRCAFNHRANLESKSDRLGGVGHNCLQNAPYPKVGTEYDRNRVGKRSTLPAVYLKTKLGVDGKRIWNRDSGTHCRGFVFSKVSDWLGRHSETLGSLFQIG